MPIKASELSRQLLDMRIAAGRNHESINEHFRRQQDHEKRAGGSIVMMSICQTQGVCCRVINGSQSYYCTVCGWVYR
jgi:hypothetical protein